MVNVGKWAFIIGLILALLAGFWTIPNLTIILVILGLIVGFLNITSAEVETYLVAVIALLVMGTASLQVLESSGNFIGTIQTMVSGVITFVAASGLVVALRAVISLGGSDEE